MPQAKQTRKSTKGAARDTTRALSLAMLLKRERVNGIDQDEETTLGQFDELIQILRDMDARSGRRDPTKRTRR